jgi:hypothetical protein
MSDQKGKRSILLEEAEKLREILDSVIAGLESGETSAALHREIDELKGKIFELLQGMKEARVEDVLGDTKKKFQDAIGNVGSSLDELSQKAQGIFSNWFDRDTIGRDQIRAIIMSEELTREYFEMMRRRNWSEQGIRESLDVLRQVLLSRI